MPSPNHHDHDRQRELELSGASLVRSFEMGDEREALDVLCSLKILDAIPQEFRPNISETVGRHLLSLSLASGVDGISKWKQSELWLKRLSDWGDTQLAARALNYRAAPTQPSAFHRMIEFGAPLVLVERALALGASVNASCTVLSSIHGSIRKSTPLHIALRSRNFAAAKALLKANADDELVDGVGDSPVHCLYTDFLACGDNDLVTELLKDKSKLLLQNSRGDSFISSAVASKDSRVLRFLADFEDASASDDSPIAYHLNKLATLIDNPPHAESLSELVRVLKGPQPLPALQQFLDAPPMRPGATTFSVSKLKQDAPRLMYEEESPLFEQSLKALRLASISEGVPRAQRFEPYLMAFLSRPQSSLSEQSQLLEIIAKGTNEALQFSSAVAIENLREIGYFSWLSPHLEYESKAVPVLRHGQIVSYLPSLFEESGFNRKIPNSEVAHLGLSFSKTVPAEAVLYKKAEGTTWAPDYALRGDSYIEYNAACFIVSSKIHGTLLIPHADKPFGVAHFKRSAYWSEVAFEPDNEPNPAKLPFVPVVSTQAMQSEVIVQDISQLLKALRCGIDQHFAWKFETRGALAGESIAGFSVMHGGYNSPGFYKLIERVRAWVELEREQGVLAPRLAFISRQHAALRTLAFGDAKQRQSFLSCSDSLVEVFQSLSEASWNDAHLAQSGVRSFFQDAGFSSEGMLVFAPPPRITH